MSSELEDGGRDSPPAPFETMPPPAPVRVDREYLERFTAQYENPARNAARAQEQLNKEQLEEYMIETDPNYDSARLNIAVDFGGLDYVADPNDRLKCPICRNPFLQPIEVGTCGHLFCASCIYEYVDSAVHNAHLCPECRGPIDFFGVASRVITQLLDELTVYCPNRRDGCTAEVQRCSIVGHVSNDCGFQQIPCPDEKCDKTIERRQAEKWCMHKKVECEYCHLGVVEKDLESHQRTVCPDAFAECPDCKTPFLRLEFLKHQPECPNTTINCPGSYLGCPLTSSRDEIQVHAKTCPMALMTPKFQKMQLNHARLAAEHKVSTKAQEKSTRDAVARLYDSETKFSESSTKLEKCYSTLFTARGEPRSRIAALLAEDRDRGFDLEATNPALSQHINFEHEARLSEQEHRMLAFENVFGRVAAMAEENAMNNMHFLNTISRLEQELLTVRAANTALQTQLSALLTRSQEGAAPAQRGAGSGNRLVSVARHHEPPKL